MNLRFPLYAKILLWFFLNLILLAAVLYGFFHIQFQAGLDSLLAGQARSRLEAIGSVIEAELREKPRSDWDAVLERFNSAYDGVEFFVFRANGTQAAGAPVEIPNQVRNRILFFRAQNPPPEPEPFVRPWRQLPKREREMRPDPGLRRPHPKFMLRTEKPMRYWIGIRLHPARRAPTPGEPEVLLAVAKSLKGGGLFFDIGPWVTVGLGALGLSILFWLPLVRGITRSISQITRATEQVAEGNFDIRVNATRRDELGRLGQAINTMSERLAGFVSGQKRFLGDAAHELCSPLARIEVALSILETRADPALQSRIADVREEAQEMASLVNEILAFSKASLRGKEIVLEAVQLADLVSRVAARETTGTTPVQVDIAEDIQALGDPALLSRAVANLIRNAVRYAGEAGPIVVRAEALEERINLTVTDAGEGIPEVALSQIFDPFFRLDSSRSRETGGFGLGLSIVKTCVQACGGSVVARNIEPSGLQVEITLNRPEKRNEQGASHL